MLAKILDERKMQIVNDGAFYSLRMKPEARSAFGIGEEYSLVMQIILGRKIRGKMVFLAAFGPGPKAEIGEQERVIGVLDLLGYKNVVSTLSIDELIEKFSDLLSNVTLAGKLAAPNVWIGKSDDFDPNDIPDAVDLTVISDTVIVQGKSNEASDAILSVCRACALIIDFGLSQGWLFRGAIDVGEFVAIPGHASFVGKALVSAYQLEQGQDWCGCTIHHSVIERFPEVVNELVSRNLLVRYAIPMKSGVKDDRNLFALNWCAYDFEKTDRNSMLAKLRARAPDRPSKSKIENTLAFLKEMKKRGLESAVEYGFSINT
jgi:hypothetical protein